MKNSKLLVLSALFAFTANSAKAGVPDNPRVMPEPTGLEFTTFTADVNDPDSHHFYLYNPQAKMFFASGNSWNTQASVRVYGYPFWMQTATEANAPEGTYELWNYVNNPQRGDVTGNHNLFFDGSSTWVDHGTQAGYTWKYYIEGDCVRFENTTKPGFFLGWDGTYIDSSDAGANSSSVLLMLDPAKEGVCVDWKAVTPDSYDNFYQEGFGEEYLAYADGVNNYIASIGLEKVLKDADEQGVSINNATALFLETSTTADELRAAKDLLNTRITLKKAIAAAQELGGVYTADAEAILADEASEQKAVTDATELVNARVNLKKAIDAAKEVFIDVTNAEAVLANNESNAQQISNAIDALKPLTEAKQALKALIDECKAAGYTETAAAEAVLQNTAAKLTEVTKATDELSAAYTEWGKSHATVENPADMTGFITNPNFDNASYDGWKGTAPNMVGSGSHGPANVAEKWNDTFDTYQDLEGLPEGIYVLSAKTSWRGSWNDMENKIGPAAMLYAKVGDSETTTPFNYIWGCYNTTPMAGATYFGPSAGENSETHDGVTYYSPNDPSAFRLYEEAGYYDTQLLTKVDAEGKIRIGVKNPQKLGDADNWSCFDTFKLTFYGNEADAWKLYLNENWGNFPELDIPEGTLVTEQYITAYEQAKKVDISNLTTKDEIKGAMDGVTNAYAALQKNIELWKQWKDACAKALATTLDTFISGMAPDEAGVLSDYLEDLSDRTGAPTIEAEHNLTNEQLEEEIAWINAAISEAEKKAKENLQPGQDVTVFMENADFEECDVTTQTGVAPGWTVKSTGGNVTAGPLGQDNYNLMVSALGKMNYCFESWHSHDFDVYQEVKDAPEGVYVIEAQGFVRCENNGYSRPNEVDPAIIPVHLYMNNATDVFPNVYTVNLAELGYELQMVESHTKEEINGVVYPNSMGAAAQCFEWGLYKMQTFGLVKAGEVMRIGVKGKMKDDDTENWWCIWDNFKLTYQGYELEYLLPALENALSKVNSQQAMGKSVKEKAKALEAQAAEAIASNDGKTIFNMLAGIYDTVAEIEASVALFAELDAAMKSLEEAITLSDADEATKSEADALCLNIQNGFNEESFENEDVAGLIAEINTMKARLAVPATWVNGTDDDPADLTSVIKSPSFINEDTWENSAAGWTNPGNLGNDDTQKSVYAMEFWQIAFDMYQDIAWLPKGTYILQVDGWCRIGNNEANYSEWTDDHNATMAQLYAQTEDGKVFAAPLANVMKAEYTDAEYEGSEALTKGDVTYWMPNSLVGGRTLIENCEGVYTNKAIVKMEKDGVLRIGVKKEEQMNNSWVVIDDFRLFYCGTDSKLNPSEDAIRDIVSSKVIRTEYFTIDGRRANASQRGLMIVKQTLENGTVVVRKVRK